jgi:hypothetical protein
MSRRLGATTSYNPAIPEASMNRFTGLAILLAASAVWASDKEKPNPADYSIQIHVQASRLVDICAPGCAWVPHLMVIIDGKKYELSDTITRNDLLRVGDYKARILKDERTYEYLRTYELLLPDGWPRKFVVVGEFESADAPTIR